MSDSDNEKEGFSHDLIHRLFQGKSSNVSGQDLHDYKFVTKFDYRTFGGDESLTEEDINRVKVTVESWIISDVRFASVNINDRGFRVTIYSNLPNGESLGRDLFFLLAKNVFPEISKSVSYGPAEE